MLDVIGFTLGSFLMQILGQEPAKPETVPLVAWQEAKIFAVPTQSDPAVEAIVKNYLKGLAAQGVVQEQQGVWIQSEWADLANNQGNIPVAAASLTKIATTLAVLDRWGAEHRFETQIYTTGALKNGVLRGDLVIQGNGDPLLVWEEAIALGNALNEVGIHQVTGNLIVIGNFYLNFKSDPQSAGELFKQGSDVDLWDNEVVKQYQTLPPGTLRPKVAIAGTVQVGDKLPENAQLILRHQSLKLAQILKQMNIYSNNEMAQMLANSIGGASVVAVMAARAAKVPAEEIQLINGSGLSVDNRISPHAVCQMLIALERQLESQSIKVADLFPVVGRDKQGTMQQRILPAGITVKTGTLAQVSALAGVIPTQERGQVWFALINHGGKIDKFRSEQDQLLQHLSQHWHITPVSTIDTDKAFLGDPSRNIKVKE
ncbi:MAG: D-alanyl-D-alanine carboxypeptidase [Microcystaceae cyanobacterium]